MRILVVGAEGNMGSRYCAILKHLEISFDKFDLKYGVKFENYYERCKYDGIIYATPTECHLKDINYHQEKIGISIPLLIEKPISKIPFFLDKKSKIMMVNQYRHLQDDRETGDSCYNFFMSGKDGIEWDCINIIGLSKRKVGLYNDSPIWFCVINGHHIPIEMMNTAYVKNISRFLKAIEGDFDWNEEREYILDAHLKVHRLLSRKNDAKQKSPHWYPSEIDQYALSK